MRYPPQRAWSNSAYPVPHGERGSGARKAARFWGLAGPVYQQRADLWPLNPEGELFAIVQIETVEGVKNIKEILNTPGLGAIDVAPNDLSLSLGVGSWSNATGNPPETEAAFQTVLKACLEYNATAAPNRKVACGCADRASNFQRRIEEGWT